MMKDTKGFTLVELLVAIAILAILSTIGFTLFQNAQSSARDARRRGDIDAIAAALETHYNAVDGEYAAIDPTKDFTNKTLPADPLNTNGFTYTISALPAAAYSACAKLENKGGNYADSAASTAATNGDYYCKINQQS